MTTLTQSQAKQNIAINVDRLMTRKSITQVQLAASVGISQATISRISAGKILPNAMVLAKIAAALGTNSAKLLGFTR